MLPASPGLVRAALNCRFCCPPVAARWEERPQPNHSWNKFLEAKRKELQRLNGAYKNTLKNANVELLEGFGRVVDAHTVDIGGKQFTVSGRFQAVVSSKLVRLPNDGQGNAIHSCGTTPAAKTVFT